MSEYIARPAREKELEEIFRLRWEIFCKELNFASVNDYPGQRETDEYDKRSHHFVIVKDNNIVGYTRLILPVEGQKFLIEHSVDLPQIFDRKHAVEVSKGLVVPSERKGPTKDLLIKAVFDYCREQGFKFILSFSNKIMYVTWKNRGINFLYVGGPVEYHGFETRPLIILVE